MNMNTMRRASPWAVPAAAAVLAVAGCTAKGGPEGGASASAAPVPGHVLQLAQFRFDDLGGGDRRIQTYPGTSTSATDRTNDGTYFYSGTVVSVDCHTTGRLVVSHPEAGERERSSYDWYHLVGVKSVEYATGTYGELLIASGDQLQECPAPQASASPSTVAPPELPPSR